MRIRPMTVQWQKVHVFISSTFNDMDAERDYLVKRVFPELQDWCERRKLRLVDVDLRWGVTEADATANANVVRTWSLAAGRHVFEVVARGGARL
jgi:hypothetical protein